jgi:flagellar protein FliO/FliZ
MTVTRIVPALFCTLVFPLAAFSAEALAAPPSPAFSAFKMVVALALVLGVIAVVAWLFRKITPIGQGQGSVARIVGGVSVGTRERVVVIQVADRWLVVGVAPGRVNAIADMQAGSLTDIEVGGADGPLTAHPFAKWLKKSIEKSNGKTTD